MVSNETMPKEQENGNVLRRECAKNFTTITKLALPSFTYIITKIYV
jgi:hypothetical protein